MRRGLLLSSVAGLGLLFAGCPPTYPNCSNDEHCKEQGQVCVQGQCQECATDANCKPGFSCEGNKCVPKAECTPGGNECGAGKKCEGGKCVTAEQEAVPGSCQGDADCASGEKCEGGRCVSGGGTCDLGPVHFDFNEASLTSDARTRLDEIADCIKKQNLKLRLEGHADDRGTEEYNLQLSNRRAESVKRYLVTLGVSSGALDTVGYGENRPAESGANESSWAANRRVEFGR